MGGWHGPGGEAEGRGGCREIFTAKARQAPRRADKCERDLYTEDTEGHGQQGAGENVRAGIKCDFATEDTENTEGKAGGG